MSEPLKKIFYFSHVDWFWIKQRPHHLAENLARWFDVTYFTPLPFGRVLLRHPLVGHDRDNKLSQTRITLSETLRVVRWHPPVPRRHARRLWEFFLRRAVRRRLREADLIWLTFPTQYEAIGREVRDRALVYDCMDSNENFESVAADRLRIVKAEAELLERSGAVFYSSEALGRKIRERISVPADHCLLVKNAVDGALFNPDTPTAMDDPAFAAILARGGKIAGYVGTVGDWLDWESIAQAARQLSGEVSFVFIGPALVPIGDLPANVHLIGPRPYQDLPAYLGRMDVGLLPFRLSELIECVNPVKIYEYLAMGLPVVARRYPEVAALGFELDYYETPPELARAVRAALDRKNDPRATAGRRAGVAAETWSVRAEAVRRRLEELLAAPRA